MEASVTGVATWGWPPLQRFTRGTDCATAEDGLRSAAALQAGSRFDAASFWRNSPSRLICPLRASMPSLRPAVVAPPPPKTATADPPRPASGFLPAATGSARPGPPKTPGPSTTAVAGCGGLLERSSSSFSLQPSVSGLSHPLPWPPLRGAIRAPGRSKRRPSMSAVPAAFCASFFLNPTRVTASRAFSHLAATAASSMAASLHRGKDSRPLFRPSI